LLLTINFLSTRVGAPTEQDNRKLDKLLRYVNNTKDLCLTLTGDKVLEPWICVDASYGSHPDGKGQSGAVEGIGEGAFHCVSKKQRIVTKSSHESEVVGVFDMLSHGLRTRQFLEQQGYKPKPTTVFQDNMAAIKSINQGKGNDSSKHIKIREFWTTDQVNLGEITLEYLRSEEMCANILTKPVTGDKFIKLRNSYI